jgi:hypothetical protein
VELVAGQVIRATVTGRSGASTALRLFGTEATSTAHAVSIAETVSAGQSRTIEHRVEPGRSGTYRLAVMADESGGEYELSWERRYETRLSVTAPSTCAWGAVTTISGKLVRSAVGSGLAGARVVADRRPYGSSTWTLAVASATTRADGTYRLSVKPRKRTRYRIRFIATQDDAASTSAIRTVTPRAHLTAPRPQSTVRSRVVFNVKGNLKPKHRIGARDVTVLVYKRESGRWVYKRSAMALNLRSSGYTRYSAWLWLPEPGTYRMVSRISGDRIHAKTISKPIILKVR